MNLRRGSLILLCLLGLALASGLAGALIGHRVARCHLEARNNPESWNEHVVQEFDRLVKPTSEQAPKLQAHFDRAVQELVAIRADTITKTTNVIWRLVWEVEQELTPEQRNAFQAMRPKPADLTLDMLKVGPKGPTKQPDAF
jgi:hypothetical protein